MDISPAPAAASIIPGQTTVAALPDPALYPRKYMWVTDLFGGPGDYVISDGTYWKPVRPLAVNAMPAADTTLTALLMAPTILVNGTIGLGITRTLTLSTQYAYPGAKFRVTRLATGVGALITSLGMSLPINGWTDMEYSGTAWFQSSSGGLL